MVDQAHKPKGTFSKLMSSSLTQDHQRQVSMTPENLKSGKPENRDSGKPESPKTGIQEIGEAGKPESPKSGNRDFLKAIKYSTQLHPDLIKRLKQYALGNDVKDYEVVQEAITEYLNTKQS
jgi:hypothetical protein